MIPRYLRDCVRLILELSVILTVVLSTTTMTQCGPKNIRNLGIKLCQLKCMKNHLCLTYEYNIETLTCRLSINDSKKIEKQGGNSGLSRNRSDAPTGSCASKTCSPGLRCLEHRSGKAICVQDEKQNYPKRSLHHKVDKQKTSENNPLHEACRKGDLGRVRRILSRRLVDVNGRDEKHGRTSLMVAAHKGHGRVIDFLIRNGADVSQVDDDGNNTLHLACRGGHMGMLRYVLTQYSVDINSRAKKGRTPLMMAAYYGHRNVFEFLVTKGADLSQVDDDGNNILHLACRGGHMGMVRYVLTQYSVDINSRAKKGRTPLMMAAYYGHRNVLGFLVTKGADVSQVDDDGNNILHWACRGGHLGMARYLLSEYSLDINSRGKYGSAPLMKAASHGHRDVFEFLVRKGANVSQVDDNGDNILHWACRGGHLGMVRYLLTEYSVDINSRGKYGSTPLMKAASHGHRKMFWFLESFGANVSQVDDDGDNILHYASSGGHPEMVKFILSQDFVDINHRGNYGRTPLMRAAYNGNIQVFDLHVSKGGRISSVDDNANNILHLATLRGRVKMVKQILSQNMTDINARDKDGETAAMIAKRKGQHGVYNLLVSRGCPAE